jgi:hypothetical protein
MLFIGLLIWLTPYIPSRLKLISFYWMCLIIFILNLVRLLLLYPIAANGCADYPGIIGCADPMWEFHYFILSWGFLIVLVGGWLIWFMAINGAERISKGRSKLPPPRWIPRLQWRNPLPLWSWAIAVACLLWAGTAVYDLSSASESGGVPLSDFDCLFDEPGVLLGAPTDGCGEQPGREIRVITLSLLLIGIAITEPRTKRDDVTDLDQETDTHEVSKNLDDSDESDCENSEQE